MDNLNNYPLEKLLEIYQISLYCGYPEKSGEDKLGQPVYNKTSWLADCRRTQKPEHGDTPREAVEKLVEKLNG